MLLLLISWLAATAAAVAEAAHCTARGARRLPCNMMLQKERLFNRAELSEL
jgi:hypothetical protein